MIRKLKTLKLLLWISLSFLSLILVPCRFMGIKINFTASMPIGFYREQPNSILHRGDLISFCLPKSIAVVGKTNGYIGRGTCPGSATSLIKEIIALPNDTVLLSPQFMQVNNTSYFAPQQELDHQDHRIKHFIKNGRYQNQRLIWVYGSGDPIHSWDSRYFGGISLKNICGIYKPLWVFR